MGLSLLSLGSVAAGRPQLRVVTTIFPLTDWARIVGGERVQVVSILPPGVEAHTFAPRPQDARTLHEADVVFYLGPDMEPWAQRLIAATERPGRVVVEVARDIPRLFECGAGCPHDHGPAGPQAPSRETAETAREREEGSAHEPYEHAGSSRMDPHVWLDPVFAQTMVRTMAEALAGADPDHAVGYRERANAYVKELENLHREIEAALARVRHREILFAGHFAFGYFARRYGLEHRSPYPGFSPDTPPTPRALAELIRRLRDTGQSVIFHEEMVDPKVARVIAAETGATLVPLHGAHNLTPEEARRGNVTYLSIMRDNLDKLIRALGTREPH